ncbi:MAG: TrmH family RNA methyltransferase [Nitrospirota bacterium]
MTDGPIGASRTSGGPRPLTASLMKQYKSLADKKGRQAAGLFMVEGHRAIQQVLTSRPDAVVELIMIAEHASDCEGVPVRSATRRQLDAICQTKTPQGAVAIVRQPDDVYADHLPSDVGPRVLALEAIQDPGNVGALIRTAAAFDYSLVILSEGCADPLAPKSVQASSGTVLSVTMRRTPAYLNLITRLKERRYHVAVADVRGDDAPSRLQQSERLVFALGNEAAGPTTELLALADHRVRIPIRERRAESLNVAACGAIGMYLGSRVFE